MNIGKSIILVATIAATVFAGPKTEQNADAKAAPVSESAVQIQLASNLSQYGIANKDALSMITAAKIVKSLSIKPDTTKKEGEATQATAAPKSTGVTPVLDLNQLLAKAKEYAGGRKDLLALIEEVKNSKSKQVANYEGWAIRDSRVDAKSIDTWPVTFVAGVAANVTISGDGDTDLDLKIYDSNDNLICEALSYIDDESCTWYPRWTGEFKVKVINRGSVYNRYQILFQ